LTDLSAFIAKYADDADRNQLSTDSTEGTAAESKHKRHVLLTTHFNDVVQCVVQSSCKPTSDGIFTPRHCKCRQLSFSTVQKNHYELLNKVITNRWTTALYGLQVFSVAGLMTFNALLDQLCDPSVKGNLHITLLRHNFFSSY